MKPIYKKISEKSHAHDENWQWAIAVTTTDRREHSTLQRTLESFRDTGFEPPVVFADLGKKCDIWNWHRAMSFLVSTYPDANAYAIVEDDVVFAKDIRFYLEKTLWPNVKSDGCICSIFTPTCYAKEERWHILNRGRDTWMSQFRIYHPKAAHRMIHEIHEFADFSSPERQNDGVIGEWASRHDVDIWFHNPSLVQHLGMGLTTYETKMPERVELGMANDFIGEDVSALDLLH